MKRDLAGVGEGGLTAVQRRFLRRVRREPRPIGRMLKESQVVAATFASWCGEEAFARAFGRATAGLTREALADLRITFALCGRIISEEVLRVMEEGRGGEVGKGEVGKKRVAKGKGEDGAVVARGAGGTTGDKALDEGVRRLCFEVIKVGMGAFVPRAVARKRRKAFPKLDPEAWERLKRARGMRAGGEV